MSHAVADHGQEVFCEKRANGLALITLNRPKALNALSLPMIRELTRALLVWRDDPDILAVAIRGMSKHGEFGAFCAGGDIRFFHQAALTGDPALEDFFTEEYTLNHMIFAYPKPYIAFMDGIVMGGGMGISQGASVRIVTERTKMAMPETNIGLFPDVGGGYFLSRCPGHLGEYLGLTGHMIDGKGAVAAGLADGLLAAEGLSSLWQALSEQPFTDGESVERLCREHFAAASPELAWPQDKVDRFFALPDATAIVQALEADGSEWASSTAADLRKRSPLMLHVVLEQIRRARGMDLAQDLRMERDLVRHCFHTRHLQRSGASSETVEGVRALAVDKDHQPRWNPPRLEDVTPEMVTPFFDSPWPDFSHPLRMLA